MKMDQPPVEEIKITNNPIVDLQKILNSKDRPKNDDISLYIFKNINSKEDFELVFDFIIENLSKKEYQPYLANILDIIGQNGQMIKPSIWFSGMEKIFSEPCLENIKNMAISSTNYLLSYFSNYREELLNNISNDGIKNYNKTGKFIKFIYYLAKYSRNWSFSEHLDEKLKEKLSKLAEQNPDSNYFLSKFSQGVIDGLNHKHNARAKELPVFQINSNKQYGAVYEDGLLHISDEKDFFIISEYIKDIENISSLKGMEDVRQLHNKAITIFNKVSDLVFKNIISPKDLFISFNKGGEVEDFKELYKNYLFLLDGIMRPIFEEEFGEKLFLMPIKEQFQFLLYAKDLKVKEIEPIKNFSKKFGVSGFRTFLSIEQGGSEMGDKILTLGEKLPQDVAKLVFAKYGEIIDNVNKIVEFAQNNFSKEIKTSPELIKKIEETLYIKGKQLLSQVYDDVSNEKNINVIEIGKQLDRINADTITTFAIFKQAVKNGEELPIESIEGSVFSKKGANEIKEEEQAEMIDLYESNWKNHPDRNFVESLKDYFKTAFMPTQNQEKNYFYTFEKDQKIRAFVRFEQQENDNLYASALNVDEASKNFGLGEAMMDEALVREAKESILYASCRKDNPSNMRYFEKGFISKGFKQTNNTEEFDLIWNEVKNKDILGKQKTKEDLIEMYLKNKYEGSIEIKKAETLNELHKDIPSGKALVRCFQNPLKKNEWYAVYEKVDDDYAVKFGETK